MTIRTPDQALLWPLLDRPGIELMSATFTTHTFPRHAHPTLGLGVSQRGVGVIHARGARHLAPPAHLILLHPGEVHWGQAQAGQAWHYRMVYLEMGALSGWLPSRGRMGGVTFPHTTLHDEGLASSFVRVHGRLQHAPTLGGEEALLTLLMRLLHKHAQSGVSPPVPGLERAAVEQMRAYLSAHLGRRVTLADLVEVTQLSAPYLTRCFRQAVGLPPHAFLTQLRVDHARALLRGALPLAQIALTCGFADQAHFTRSFKRLVGTTPAQYRGSFRSRPRRP